jgi:hypothetical protein
MFDAGILPPAMLWEQSLDVLSEKCDKLMEHLP